MRCSLDEYAAATLMHFQPNRAASNSGQQSAFDAQLSPKTTRLSAPAVGGIFCGLAQMDEVFDGILPLCAPRPPHTPDMCVCGGRRTETKRSF